MKIGDLMTQTHLDLMYFDTQQQDGPPHLRCERNDLSGSEAKLLVVVQHGVHGPRQLWAHHLKNLSHHWAYGARFYRSKIDETLKTSWEIIQKWVWIWNFVSRESFAKSMKVLQLSESTALCDSGLDPKSIDRSIENHLGGKGRPMADPSTDPYRLHPSKASTQWLSGTPDFPLATAVRTLLTPCFVHRFAGPTFWGSLSAFYLDRRTWSLLLQIE